jgi:hypothetical protein
MKLVACETLAGRLGGQSVRHRGMRDASTAGDRITRSTTRDSIRPGRPATVPRSGALIPRGRGTHGYVEGDVSAMAGAL